MWLLRRSIVIVLSMAWSLLPMRRSPKAAGRLYGRHQRPINRSGQMLRMRCRRMIRRPCGLWRLCIPWILLRRSGIVVM
jgi:hypothetical protein